MTARDRKWGVRTDGFLSDDDGKTWPGLLLTNGRGSPTPTAMQAPDWTIRTLRPTAEDKQIYMARFTDERHSQRTHRLRLGKLGSSSTSDRDDPKEEAGDAAPSVVRSSNADGVPLASGPAAAREIRTGEIYTFAPVALLFMDRTMCRAELRTPATARKSCGANIRCRRHVHSPR
jgi:hypothetical protein